MALSSSSPVFVHSWLTSLAHLDINGAGFASTLATKWDGREIIHIIHNYQLLFMLFLNGTTSLSLGTWFWCINFWLCMKGTVQSVHYKKRLIQELYKMKMNKIIPYLSADSFPLTFHSSGFHPSLFCPRLASRARWNCGLCEKWWLPDPAQSHHRSGQRHQGRRIDLKRLRVWFGKARKQVDTPRIKWI